jgi:predicted ATPase
MPYHIALLARACEIAGQIEEALTQFDEALQIVERTGERWFAAELHRHRGRLLLRQGHSEAAEELYRSLEHCPGARGPRCGNCAPPGASPRLRRDQGRHAEARDLLAPVYAWFTEGFDTSDLKEAKALLEALNA